VNCLTKSIDLYKREVAICYGGKSGENELNKIMVQQGMAFAYRQYSKKYVVDELKAKKEFAGIWNSAFMKPDDWRRFQKFKSLTKVN
jgi:endonuclease YncB( thermonuclease family)